MTLSRLPALPLRKIYLVSWTSNGMNKPNYPATDIVIFTIENGQLSILLIKRGSDPFRGSWALPGGFIHENESPEESAARILKDKAGLSNVYVEQLYTFADSGRDPRGNIVTVTHFALVHINKIKLKKSPKTQTPTLFTLKKLPQLAFDHGKIIKYALKRLRAKLEYTNAVYSLLTNYFTFNDLQNAYETILSQKLDKRNFRKKFLQLGLIKPTNKHYLGTRQRPAQLFQFISHKPSELKKFF